MTDLDELLAKHQAEHVAKLHIKKRLREKLRLSIEENGEGNSQAVVEEVAGYLRERPFLKVVAVYAALPGEVDLKTLPSLVGCIWVFPKVEGELLSFFQVKSFEEDLTPGSYGILEPREGLEKIEIERIDLFLCPGLGFDVRGGRIGRGRGFYDRMLERARPGAVKLGVCFGHQVVDEVDMEHHDVRMNGVIAG
ncbi:MAG: 5-formyltetrahydrofolate cyclo-ligase [Akkermansiaceae bacterium]|jgi:5-formyltetrahydrofolate cyclo-ligase|nr:5-formyltetrahydrofolate cyclo-ligase [Akkermansiaceae bacterium]MDP4720217.1 5-formyltetrahydrofolate cyclo-ligase [Akkermansiaceae bacterium]MDP4780503.1 5-formyltetrahydrofolate cyclo-ligase [Akkermansiaceae bacterium]MDP4847198.1 5-formyltetrahydrofolate cyclo-ligase [Akkermansiaceae bacterium]MDP4897944.1 5-formyltetrahydrofolate cyclo-ligase [Akkermansiaceae bacterium]